MRQKDKKTNRQKIKDRHYEETGIHKVKKRDKQKKNLTYKKKKTDIIQKEKNTDGLNEKKGMTKRKRRQTHK